MMVEIMIKNPKCNKMIHKILKQEFKAIEAGRTQRCNKTTCKTSYIYIAQTTLNNPAIQQYENLNKVRFI